MPPAPSPRTERGQILALFALSATVLVLAVGLVIDGGNALYERRASQNASDFAALAGARIIAEWIGGDTTNGTDANVKAAITTTAAANGADPITFGAPNGPSTSRPTAASRATSARALPGLRRRPTRSG